MMNDAKTKRRITRHAIDRLRERVQELSLLELGDDGLRSLLDSSVDDSIRTGLSRTIEERGVRMTLVQLSGDLDGLWAMVRRDNRCTAWGHAVVTVETTEMVEKMLACGRWAPTSHQDAEMARDAVQAHAGSAETSLAPLLANSMPPASKFLLGFNSGKTWTYVAVARDQLLDKADELLRTSTKVCIELVQAAWTGKAR